MKIRQTHVTNSSSSSFVVFPDEAKKTTAELAYLILEAVLADIKPDPERWGNWIPKIEEILQYLIEHLEYNGAIHVPYTPQYTTLLHRIGGTVAVNTSRNYTQPLGQGPRHRGTNPELEENFPKRDMIVLDLIDFTEKKAEDIRDVWEYPLGWDEVYLVPRMRWDRKTKEWKESWY